MKLWIGTSGFQYSEWKGTFYPEDLPSARMLPFYSQQFSTTEINYTFHRIPSAKTIDGWCAATPDAFKFALKAPQKITHFAKLKNCADTLSYFFGVISGLERKLGPVLFQLPPGLKKDLPLLEAFLSELPSTLQAACEFRHESWLQDEIFSILTARNVALCVADSEKLSTPPLSTAGYGLPKAAKRGLQRRRYCPMGGDHQRPRAGMDGCLHLFQARGEWHWTEPSQAIGCAPGRTERQKIADAT